VAESGQSRPTIQRVPELDGLRGCAILLVLIFHYVGWPLAASSSPDQTLSVITQALSLTWSGVDLFFVLSGFLIGGILLDHRQAPNYFQVFYLRRICRIVPLYVALIGLFLVVQHLNPADVTRRLLWLFEPAMPLWSYLTFTQNVYMAAWGLFGAQWLRVTWSLAIEGQFYMVFPWVVRHAPVRYLLVILLCGIVLAPLIRYSTDGRVAGFVSTFGRMDTLFCGALLALIVRKPDLFAFLARHVRRVRVVVGLLFAVTVILAFGHTEWGGVVHSWLAALYGGLLLLPLLDRQSVLARTLRSSVLGWLGHLSYAIYLFHQPINHILHGMISATEPLLKNWEDAGITLGALLITLLMAQALHVWIEKPIIRLGHRVRYSQ